MVARPRELRAGDAAVPRTLLGSDGTDRPDVGHPRPARHPAQRASDRARPGCRLHPPERHGQGPDRVRLVGRLGDLSPPRLTSRSPSLSRKASRGPSFRPAGGMPHSGSSFSTMPTCVGRGTRLAHCCRFSSRLTRQVPWRRDGIGHLSGPACRTAPASGLSRAPRRSAPPPRRWERGDGPPGRCQGGRTRSPRRLAGSRSWCS